VAQAAARAAVPVVAFVGRLALTADEARAAGFADVRALTDLERCQRAAATLLTSLARHFVETSPLVGADPGGGPGSGGPPTTPATADSAHAD
jgi:hypothetical protein